jgi:hypothetical protein
MRYFFVFLLCLLALYGCISNENNSSSDLIKNETSSTLLQYQSLENNSPNELNLTKNETTVEVPGNNSSNESEPKNCIYQGMTIEHGRCIIEEQPKFCQDDGIVVDKANICGCAIGFEVDLNSSLPNISCVSKKCTDGTKIGNCSLNKPKYCQDDPKGTGGVSFIDKSEICGCPQGSNLYKNKCAKFGEIGETLSNGDVDLTINSITYNSSGRYDTSDNAIINMTIHNLNIQDEGYFFIRLSDHFWVETSNGNQYPSDYFSKTCWDGCQPVLIGDSWNGLIYYDIRNGEKLKTVIFNSGYSIESNFYPPFNRSNILDNGKTLVFEIS